MGKIVKTLIVLLILSSLVICVKALELHSYQNNIPPIKRETIFGDNIYQSNRYSQVEDTTIVNFDSNVSADYQEIGVSNELLLYYNEENHYFIVKNKKTGYLWYSYPQTDESLPKAAKAIVYLEYYPFIKSKNDLDTSYIRESSVDAKITSESITNGISLKMVFPRSQIEITVSIFLNESELVVEVLDSLIVETEHKIASISVFPNFGSTKKDTIPGYFFVPDGIGALYRFKESSNYSSLSENYFGIDRGMQLVQSGSPLKFMSLPIFGIIHGVSQHGLLGIIEKGSYQARLTMIPSGSDGLDFNRIYPVFVKRNTYLLPYNLKGEGSQTVLQQRHEEDIIMRYQFLEEEQADYVGLAQKYQDYLVETGVLTERFADEVKLRLEVIMADSEKGLFGKNTVVMTKLNDLSNIVSDLIKENINLELVLRGYNKGGMSGRSPYPVNYDSKLGSKKAFENYFDELNDSSIKVRLYQNFVFGYEDSELFKTKDAARGTFRWQIKEALENIVYKEYYYIKPEQTANLIRLANLYENVTFAHSDLGSQLFSTYENGKWYSTNVSVNHYIDALQEEDYQAFYKPYSYMFAYMDAYYDMPLYNTQYTLYDDTVPFLPVVLRGYVDYYSPLLNFSSNEQEHLLNMIDYGMYPSYIVTKEPSHLLKFTQARNFYSTLYDVWENPIKDNYNYVNEALKNVVGEKIYSRKVIDYGIIETTYANGYRFIINYRNTSYTHNGVTILPQSYNVTEVKP